MISIHCKFDSQILKTRVPLDIYLPDKLDYMAEPAAPEQRYRFAPFKTLYALHGAWDDASQWVEQTSILRMAQDKRIAVVMPSVGNSFYADTLYGMDYEAFFEHEVIGFARGIFPLSDKREDNYIIGTSMGGYGALKASIRTGMFSKAILMSAVVDISASARLLRTFGINTDQTVGKWKELKGSKRDIITMLDELDGDYSNLPEIYMICGTEDYIYQTNKNCAAEFEKRGIRFTFKEYPGLHEWAFWDAHLKEAVDWL